MIDENLSQSVDAFIEAQWENIVADISSLVSISSIESLEEAAPGAPWGPGPRAALTAALEIAERLGLDAHDCEGYIGYVDLAGSSNRQIATIAHVDTVPVGSGWDSNPLELVRKDGYLLGRGVQDDKGPTVLSLYMAKYFLDQGKQLPYTLRCLIGCNEETGMRDAQWYLKHFEQPAFLFTPDADFGVGCGEKGGFTGSFISDELGEANERVIVELDGGTVRNAIPSEACALVKAEAASLEPVERIDIVDEGEGITRIVAHGIGGHASLPEGTLNAIGLLVDYLLENNLCSNAERTFLELERVVLGSTDGSTMGIAATDDIFDPLTCIGGTIRTKDERFVQSIDARYPKSTTAEFLEQTVNELASAYGASFEVDRIMVPYLTEPDSAPIQILLSTYNEIAKDDAKPFTMGGGTYARWFERAASFGPANHNIENPSWVGSEHGPNEGISEEALKMALKVYIISVARLMEEDL